MLRHVPAVTIFAGVRYEFAPHDAETLAHEVSIRFPEYILPSPDAPEYEGLVETLLETLSVWARECAATPPAQGEDLTERILRASATES